MAVHRRHDDAVLGACGNDARHIAVVVERHLQLARLAALDVEAPRRHFRVVLACFRIFVAVESGIVGVFVALRLHSSEHLQRILFHLAFVEANPTEHRAVGREAERATLAKFLFINPVGHAVDDFVELAVLRHLRFGVVVEQFHEENVTLAHESDLRAVGTPERCLLLAVVGKSGEMATVDVVNIIVRLRRTAIDGLGSGLDEQSFAVGRGDVAVDALDFLALRLVGVEEHGGFLPRLERILHDALAVGRNAGVLVGACQRIDSVDAFRRKFSAHHGLDGQVVSGDGRCGGKEKCRTNDEYFFHKRCNFVVNEHFKRQS